MHAYDQLLAEGYLRSLGGGGTFVADVVPDHVLWSEKATTPQGRIAAPVGDRLQSGPQLSLRGQRVVNGASALHVQWGAFVPGVPDVTEFPHRKFAQITARLWRKPAPQLLSYSTGGHLQLRRELAAHLRQARSVSCDADQIVITEGLHQAVDLITRVLGDPGDRVWMEEPGYWGIRSLLAINGMEVKSVPVDAEGFAPEERHRGTPPKLIFVTPSHQYPLGCVMSLQRRLALLEFANEHSSWIVEDDYDSEFRFSGHPIPSLQGLVTEGPVIYLGTFSKSLYPGMRLAYMVLPRVLAKSFLTAQSELYREGHLMTQAVLAEFIGAGHYAAHIRRMRLIYASRRGALIDLVQERLGPGWVHELDTNAGLHLVLSLPEGTDDVAIARRARERGVVVRPLSEYYADRPARPGLILGFACVAESEMAAPFEVLVECIKEGATRL
jgi:GntR family transcriptional regulator / MocR family aminotransferase